MQVVNKNEVLKLSDGTRFKGYVRMGSYTESPTKNGGAYLSGTVQAMGDCPFKVWSGACFNVMKEKDYTGQIVGVEGNVNEYNGTKSFIFDTLYEVTKEDLEEDGVKESDFFPTKYDTEAYWDKMNAKLRKNISEEAYQAYMLIMHDYVDRFKEEFAAVSYHDNCKGGLLAHTTKVVNICGLLKMYPNISARVNNDILYVGAAIHDLGKVLEYSNGINSEIGNLVSHNTLGILCLMEHKDAIIKLKGEEFFNIMMSIISQHHGDYGDRPRTIAAYIIHQFDLLDSSLTLLDQTLENNSDSQVRFDGLKLS